LRLRYGRGRRKRAIPTKMQKSGVANQNHAALTHPITTTLATEISSAGLALRNDQELREKTSYILMNPVRKGLCERAEDWVWIYRPNNRMPPLLG
jgi:hypothetical protein